MFAPYKVATWDDIPAAFKDADGTWVNDYGGYMSIGYDSAKVPAVTDRRRPAEAGVQGQGRAQRRPDPGRRRVLRRDDGRASPTAARPTTSRPASSSSRKLKKAGNFLPVDPTPATIESGQTPVVIDWDYSNAARDREAADLAGRRPAERRGRAATTTRRSTPTPRTRRGPAVAGVPLQRRGPEPVRCGRGPAGARRRDGQGGHHRQGGVSTSSRRSTGRRDHPDRRPRPTRPPQYLADNWAKAIG